MNIYNRLFKLASGLIFLFFAFRLVYYIVVVGKDIKFPLSISLIGTVSLCGLLILGVGFILLAFEDKLRE
jgi:hypothetical protein